jgi:hypothetical protein
LFQLALNALGIASWSESLPVSVLLMAWRTSVGTRSTSRVLGVALKNDNEMDYEQIAGEMEIAVGVARATALASTHLDLFASASSTGFMRSAEPPWLGRFVVGVCFLAFSG